MKFLLRLCLPLLSCCWLHVCLLESVSGESSTNANGCPDEYSYTYQPPEDLVCNPYINKVLLLDCGATGPDIARILWYFSNTSTMSIYDEDTVLINANSSKYTLTPVYKDIENGVRIELTVNLLNEDDDMGSYWCRAMLHDGQLLSMSGFFELQSSDMYPPNFPCPPASVKNADIRCASIFTPEATTELPSMSSSTLPPSTFHTPSPTPTTTDKITTSGDLSNTNSQTDTATESPSLVESSQFVLYAVLVLVGLLGIVCIVLVLVILLLCRRRCRRIGLEGSENKESAFEQLSNQSDMALINFKRNNDSPFHPDISLQIPSSRTTSGDYAEIGPVLMTLHSQNNSNSSNGGHSNSVSPPLPAPPPGQAHNYSEIRQLLPHSNVTLPPIPQQNSTTAAASAGSMSLVDPYHITGYENPYDVPVLPREQQQQRQQQPPQQVSPHQSPLVPLPPAPPLSPSSVESVDSSHHVSSSRRTHDYQILERMLPVRHEPGDTISESSSFSTPPLSPHNYHTLEDEQVSQDFSQPATTSTLPPSPMSPDFEHQSRDSVQLSCDSIEVSGPNRLPTIPEHPYNISEEDLPSALEDDEEEENETPVKFEPTPTPTKTTKHSSIAVSRSDIVTPSYTDPELSEGLAVADGFTETSKDTDEQEYDRLIDPTHLYHILEHSTKHPRLHELANRSYSQLEPNKQARASGVTSIGKGHRLQMQFHNPHIDRMTADSPTSDSSIDEDKDIFDDPQYQVSPLKRRKPPLIRSNSDSSGHIPRHINSTKVVHPPRSGLNIDKDVGECSAVSSSDLTKYRGDYERDPSYMLQLKKKASRDSCGDLDGVTQDTVSMHEDSGFLTFSGSSSPVNCRHNLNPRRGSLPDLPHVYQALEASTLNCLQPYERLQKK